jgi:hypothetical protein
MAKPNYAFQKRQKELAKKQKKETKRQQKAAPLTDPLSEAPPPLPAESTTTA